MTQSETISNHLQNIGSITPLEAQSNYNVWRLAAVINVLKHLGIPVQNFLPVLWFKRCKRCLQ